MARYRRFDTARVDAQPADASAMDEARLRRAGLKAALSDLELALAAAAPGRLDEWARGVAAKLEVLHNVWTRHIVETEAPDAFLDELVEDAPRLANQAMQLRREHGEILDAITHAEELLAMHPEDDAFVETLRSDLTTVLCDLARHRQRGADLVYQAYAVDLGGGG